MRGSPPLWLCLGLLIWACDDEGDTGAPLTPDAGSASGQDAAPPEADAAPIKEDAAPIREDATPPEVDATIETDAALPELPPIPLAEDSPWPKFRHDPAQTGRTEMIPAPGGNFWVKRTNKGIFSSPVIGGDGTIYIGSADQIFYALNPADGAERWTFQTGEIIDSSGLLDDQGRVYFGSGDGHLYALDAQSGDEVWRFEADEPSGLALIRWFEGNVAMAPGGDLIVPNDNFFVYSIDRDTGAKNWSYRVKDQTWSLAAIDGVRGRIFFGNNNMVSLLGANVFALDLDGREIWSQGEDGTIAASPALTPSGLMVLGGFNGFVRAYDMESGDERWRFGARDHIYASPSVTADGALIQPGADGTVYALEETTGEVRWTFDVGDPIRSSPAIDGEGRIYFGAGNGRLYALEPDGALAWSMQLITEDRNDLNGSPALGRDAIYIAGESGEIFSVPYDYCAREANEPRCEVGGAPLGESGVSLLYTTAFGTPLAEAPQRIDPNQILGFSLFVREGGETQLTLLDTRSVQVTAEPPTALEVTISADRHFLTVRPVTGFAVGEIELSVTGDYLINPEREGLRFTGGETGGAFEERFTFTVEPPDVGAASHAAWIMSRLAAPMPTILPSYNQIGFDSLHYFIAAIEPVEAGMLGWVVGAKLEDGEVLIDPATKALFPLIMHNEGDLFSFRSEGGLSLQVMNADIAFSAFSGAARLLADGPAMMRLAISAVCGEIALYGPFLRQLGLCNPETDTLHAFGATLIEPIPAPSLEGAGVVTFSVEGGVISAALPEATLKADEHVFSLLLLDAAGHPLEIAYGLETIREADDGGLIRAVRLPVPEGLEPTRALLIIDISLAGAADL
ncbi:PQQ-binding-like beta-propeller repeat protein [Myxococcota bacterium]|nr:PQQ-binding-like beta-propeller repeat protein [Myxococcota bacterium]MBU1899540.1 PQQ-binding-like beta-propeller repeat protein [Myxococcota bacterium]